MAIKSAAGNNPINSSNAVGAVVAVVADGLAGAVVWLRAGWADWAIAMPIVRHKIITELINFFIPSPLGTSLVKNLGALCYWPTFDAAAKTAHRTKPYKAWLPLPHSLSINVKDGALICAKWIPSYRNFVSRIGYQPINLDWLTACTHRG
jgi:hypothetical protein